MPNDKLTDQLQQLKDFCSKCEKELVVYFNWALENDGILSTDEIENINKLNAEIQIIKKRIAQIEKAKGINSVEPEKNLLSKATDFVTNVYDKTVEVISDTVEYVTEVVSDFVSDTTSINDSVGKGGKNNAEDVIKIKILLNRVNNAGLTEDNPNCADKTIQSILNYQNKIGTKATGLILPDDETWCSLKDYIIKPSENNNQQNTPKKLVYEDMVVNMHGQEFLDKLVKICKNLGLDPNFMLSTMYVECRFNPKAQNPKSKASGLIQFMPSTAVGLGTTVDNILKLKAIDQLDWVEKYYNSFKSLLPKIKEPAESYFVVFYPAAIGKPDSYILGSERSDDYAKKVASQNGIYDLNKNGYITKGEVLKYQREHNYKDVYLQLSDNDNQNEIIPSSSLKGQVGKNKLNKKEDVAAIQKLLNNFSYTFNINGNFDYNLSKAIIKFQSDVLKYSNPDGIVDPGQKTWRVLNGEKIENTNSASPTPSNKPKWISIAEAEIGQKEISGSENNSRILEYHSSTSGKATSETIHWCSAFVNWVMTKSGYTGTNNAVATSWAKWGKKINQPAYGSIAVIDWDGPGPGWKGHVGFVVGKKGSSILLLGGNQSDAVNISSFSTNRVIAYIYPSNFDIPSNYLNLGESNIDNGNDLDINKTR
jgi:uncharacterized protein (TIGR02594 family)